ncbi:MAG: hypothetical protein V2A61_07810 [Calditrichota bacterium]
MIGSGAIHRALESLQLLAGAINRAATRTYNYFINRELVLVGEKRSIAAGGSESAGRTAKMARVNIASGAAARALILREGSHRTRPES